MEASSAVVDGVKPERGNVHARERGGGSDQTTPARSCARQCRRIARPARRRNSPPHSHCLDSAPPRRAPPRLPRSARPAPEAPSRARAKSTASLVLMAAHSRRKRPLSRRQQHGRVHRGARSRIWHQPVQLAPVLPRGMRLRAEEESGEQGKQFQGMHEPDRAASGTQRGASVRLLSVRRPRSFSRRRGRLSPAANWAT